MTRFMQGNQHSQHPKKHKKQPETRKQVSQQMAEDSRIKQREIELIIKKSEEKKKEDVQNKKLIAAPCEGI